MLVVWFCGARRANLAATAPVIKYNLNLPPSSPPDEGGNEANEAVRGAVRRRSLAHRVSLIVMSINKLARKARARPLRPLCSPSEPLDLTSAPSVDRPQMDGVRKKPTGWNFHGLNAVKPNRLFGVSGGS